MILHISILNKDVCPAVSYLPQFVVFLPLLQQPILPISVYIKVDSETFFTEVLVLNWFFHHNYATVLQRFSTQKEQVEIFPNHPWPFSLLRFHFLCSAPNQSQNFIPPKHVQYPPQCHAAACHSQQRNRHTRYFR